MMETIESLQKELQQMGDHFKRLQDNVAQLAQEQAQVKEAQAGENTEAIFTSAERKGAAYPLEGHVMGQVDPKTKDAYLSLLLFTWSLLQPEAKEADAGLVTVARIRESLHVDTSLYNLFCHMKEKFSTDLETWFQKIDQADGKSAYLLDTLILCQEMKVENDSFYGKLSQLYMLMGCKESMLEEAIEAVSMIYERNRYKYVLCEKQEWKSFKGNAGECYLDLVGDLNTQGKVDLTRYYALWPVRLLEVKNIPKYPPKVMLKIEAPEGAKVKKGQTLFTLYGVSNNLERGFLDKSNTIEYSGSSDWGYVFVKRSLAASSWYQGKDEDAAQIKDDQERLKESLLNEYKVISVKADVGGFLHWCSCLQRSPFLCIKDILYYPCKHELYWARPYSDYEEEHKILLIGSYDTWQESVRKEGRDPLKLRTGDIFVSSDSLTPTTIKNMPICVVEKM